MMIRGEEGSSKSGGKNWRNESTGGETTSCVDGCRGVMQIACKELTYRSCLCGWREMLTYRNCIKRDYGVTMVDSRC